MVGQSILLHHCTGKYFTTKMLLGYLSYNTAFWNTSETDSSNMILLLDKGSAPLPGPS